MKKRVFFFVVLLVIGTVVMACAEVVEAPAPAEAPEEEAAPSESSAADASEAEADTAEPAQTEEAAGEAEVQSQAAAPSGRIVFPVYDEARETYDIFWAKADGSDRQLLVEEASQPDLKPDGQFLVYRSWQPDDRGIYEYNLQEEQNVWRINEHFEAGRPLYFPDGKSFMFQSREAGEDTAVYQTAGTDYDVLRREGNPIQGEAPVLTPDGNAFVYKTCVGGDCGLYYSNLDGSSLQQLTTNLSDTNPAISPDGQTVAFMSETDGNWDVYTVGIDGTNRARLTENEERDGLPTWSPDGSRIAYVSERDAVWAMWSMAPDGSNKQELFELGGTIDGQVTIDVANSFGWTIETIDWEAVE